MYFKVDNLAINNDFLFHEICTDSSLVGLEELLIDVTMMMGKGTNWEEKFCQLWDKREKYAESPRMMTFESFFLLIGGTYLVPEYNCKSYYLSMYRLVINVMGFLLSLIILLHFSWRDNCWKNIKKWKKWVQSE